jgi:hypothetical protein
VVLGPGAYQQVLLEGLWVEACGGDGLAVHADPSSQGIFLAAVTVGPFGGGRPAAGLRLAGRVQAAQVSIAPVGGGQVGIALEPGSEHTSITSYHVGLAPGGAAVVGDEGREGLALGVGTVEELERP